MNYEAMTEDQRAWVDNFKDNPDWLELWKDGAASMFNIDDPSEAVRVHIAFLDWVYDDPDKLDDYVSLDQTASGGPLDWLKEANIDTILNEMYRLGMLVENDVRAGTMVTRLMQYAKERPNYRYVEEQVK
jgi:hypothetical protein